MTTPTPTAFATRLVAPFTARLATLTLAAVFTLATLSALDTLAHVEAAAPQVAQVHGTQA
jgi:hypothetical protein